MNINLALKSAIFALFAVIISACSATERQLGTNESYTNAANKRFGLYGYYILKFGENSNIIAGLNGKKAGAPAASGEKYDPASYTAAHKTLPFNTIVRASNLANGRSAELRINDRLSNADTRSILLSKAAADELGIGDSAHIDLEIVAFALFSPEVMPKKPIYAASSSATNAQLTGFQSIAQIDTMPHTTPQTMPQSEPERAGGEFNDLKGEILVQIGAYRDQNNARKMQELYASFRKYTAFTDKCVGERLYCVYLRGFESIAEARYFIKTSPTWDNFIVINDRVVEYSGRTDEPRDIDKERREKSAKKHNQG